MTNAQKVTSSADLAGSYLKTLKARGADVGVWEIRGRVFARVMVAARDAHLSGAEWSILTTVALHLQHLGRSKGMMTLSTLADDCMVTERTVRNALRILAASKFISATYRASGQMVVMLDRRFHPKAAVPVNKSVDNSPRRCVPRKKISTNGNSSLRSSFPLKDNVKIPQPAKKPAGRESTAFSSQAQTTNGNGATIKTAACSICRRKLAGAVISTGSAAGRIFSHVCCNRGPDLPRKRARDPGP